MMAVVLIISPVEVTAEQPNTVSMRGNARGPGGMNAITSKVATEPRVLTAMAPCFPMRAISGGQSWELTRLTTLVPRATNAIFSAMPR